MKKLFFVWLLGAFSSVYAQQTVSIGTTSTKANAILWLKATSNQGLLLPAVQSRNSFTIASPDEKGMMIFDLTDNKVYYWNGSGWIETGTSSGASESDGVIGNEISLVNTSRGGLELTGSGNASSPFTVGMIEGTTEGQVLKWDNTNKQWVLGADNEGGAPAIDNSSIGFNGSSQLEVKDLGISGGKLQNAAVTDAKVAPGISGSKINPNFGSQTISTTGSLLVGGSTTFNTRIYTWPGTAAAANTFLRNDGSGNLSWQSTGSTLDQTAQTGVLIGNGTAISGIASGGSSRYFRRNAANTAFEFAALTAADIPSLDAGKIGTGILPVAHGGTGTSVSPGLGQFLIGNGSGGYAPGTLTASDIPSLDAAKITTGTFPLTRIAGAGAGTRAILGSDNGTLTWVSGAPNQLLGTDATGVLGFANISNFTFTNDNVLPKGSPGGMIASQLFDNGSYIGLGNTNPDASLTVGSPLGSGWVIPAVTVGGTNGGGFEAGSSAYRVSVESGPAFSRSIIASSENTGYGNGKLEMKASFVGIDQDAPITTDTKFAITTSGPNGGMYINSPSTAGRTYYGYAMAGTSRAYTYFDGSSSQWRLFNNGDLIKVSDNGNISLGNTFPHHQTFTLVNSIPSTSLKVVTIAPVDVYTDDSPGILEIAGAGANVNDEIGIINFTNIANNSNDYNFARISAHRANTNNTHASLRFYTRNGASLIERMRIDDNGFVGVGRAASANRLEVEGEASKTTSGGWSANSDQRIKTDIQNIDDGVATINKLRPVRFKYTDEWKKSHPSIEDKYYYSFIAQEFQRVFPDAVKGSGEYLEGDAKEILQIDPYNAQIVAIKAIQELAEKVEKLEEENQVLRKQNQQLQSDVKKELDDIRKLMNVEAKAR